MAGAMKMPFFPLRSYLGADMDKVNPRIQWVESPYDGERIAVVPPINPDVTIIHAPRADESGNTQLWGLLGCQKEAAFAAERVIVVVEEIVDESVIRSDPNRTLIPGLIVDAVVHEPYGAHPSYVQGYYDRDNDFYLKWDELSREQEATEAWLNEWVYGVKDRGEYVRRLGPDLLTRIRPGDAPAHPVNYGRYA
jgi:glutaconate CoA-transferase subunit A